MELSKTNKTLVICSFYIAGIVATLLGLVPYLILLAAILAIYFLYFRIISYKYVVVNIFTILFAIFYINYKIPTPDYLSKIVPANISLTGRVMTQPRGDLGDKTKFELQVGSYRVSKAEWKSVNARTLVTIFDRKKKFRDIYAGDVVEIKGKLRLPYRATNPGQFDYRKYLGNSGVFTTVFVKYNDFKIIEHPSSGKWHVLQNLTKFKDKIVTVHKENLKSPKWEVLGGIVFGDYAVPAPKDVKQDFINSGLLHLLAASGMNVGIIFGLWFFVTRKLLMPYKLTIITGAIIVAFYAVLTGMPPSVTRATWMLEFILLGKLIDRQADNVALLSLVCAIMLLFDPLMITDVGFQLSFLVTFGLLACIPVLIEKTKPVPEIVSGSVLIPVVAQIWAAPVQLFHFNSFSMYSVLANIMVLPFVGAISFLGFISSIFSVIPAVGGHICWLLDKITDPLISVLLYISKLMSSLPHSLEYFATPNIFAIILFYALVLVVTLHIKEGFSKRRLNVVICVLIAVIGFFSFKDYFSKDLKFLFFDVGEADSILIHTPNNYNILVDTGNSGMNDFTAANTIIIPYLRDVGIKKLDAVVLTHPDKDHIGGMLDILKKVQVEQVLDNGGKSDTATFKRLQDYMRNNRINRRILKDGEGLEIDKDIKIKVINNAGRRDVSHNDKSVVLSVYYKEFSALLMGDCEATSLNLLKKEVTSPVNLIKIGHHGSFKSVSNDFIKFLQPKVAVISVGKNDYSHPDRHALSVLEEFNIKTYRTDKNHAVEIRTNGQDSVINTYDNSWK